MLFELIFVCFFSFATLFITRKAARKFGLVDSPNSRKLHLGNIPLAGGIAICITLTYFIFSNHSEIDNAFVFLPLMIILTLVGSADDKFELSVRFLLSIQCAVAIIMMYLTGHQLESLGN